MAATCDTGQPRKLHRNLSVWEAIGISLALMAPSMAANINPQGTATTVGRAVPIAFALAFVGVLLVAYTFVRLCQYYQHAGSVYAFVGATRRKLAYTIEAIDKSAPSSTSVVESTRPQPRLPSITRQPRKSACSSQPSTHDSGTCSAAPPSRLPSFTSQA